MEENSIEDEFTKQNLFAALIYATVENKSFGEALENLGLPKESVLSQLFAPHNSDAAIDYIKETIAKLYAMTPIDDGSELYVVKKVLCSPDKFDDMAEAISGDHTDKFKVLRLIGSYSGPMGCKHEIPGMEVYLISGKTPLDAMKKTNIADPTFADSDMNFSADEAKEFDRLITDALYKHSPEAIDKVLGYRV